MIRYAYDPQAVAADVTRIDANWFAKAAQRTQALIAAGTFSDPAPIWSSAKPAFMRVQHNKCVFCERQHENEEFGRIEVDVEHFRPKSSATTWPDPRRHAHLSYAFATGQPSPAGYFWLAYDLANYAASCKVCNTTFKLNYFPVAGSRGAAPAGVDALTAGERPYLCYPIGAIDADPESLVSFVATTAVPAAAGGHDQARGRVIIDFFGLNEREQLHKERARMISLFGPALRAVTAGIADAADLEVVARMTRPDLPHAACIRAFGRLWQADPALGRRVFDACRLYALSDPGTPPPGT